MTCKHCKHWKHDPTDKQDRGMVELGYKPCRLDNFIGRYLHKDAKACGLVEKIVNQYPNKD